MFELWHKLLDPFFYLLPSYCFYLFEFCPSLFLYEVNVLMKHIYLIVFRLVEAKAVVFECGPQCGCGPSCVNRASQRGLKYRLEVLNLKPSVNGVIQLFISYYGGFDKLTISLNRCFGHMTKAGLLGLGTLFLLVHQYVNTLQFLGGMMK